MTRTEDKIVEIMQRLDKFYADRHLEIYFADAPTNSHYRCCVHVRVYDPSSGAVPEDHCLRSPNCARYVEWAWVSWASHRTTRSKVGKIVEAVRRHNMACSVSA